MHTRTYFVARILAAVAVAILVLTLSSFVLSFVIFSIYESGEQFLLGFGGHGIVTFFAVFPTLPLIADIALLFLLEWLLQGFKFGYRVSLLTVFFGVCISSAVLAGIVNFTSIHPLLQDRADRGELPIVGEFYRDVRDSHQSLGVFRGTVTSIQGDHIVITHNDEDHDPDDGTWTVLLPQGNMPELRVGDRVYVFGTLTGQVVQAEGLEKLSADQ